MKVIGLILLPIMLTTGCAHTRLAWQTPRQAATLTEIHEKQILDNLALLCANAGETPHFAVASGGSSQATLQGSATSGLIWNATTLTTQALTLNGSGQQAEQWSLTPITDPLKLKMMKCILLHAAGCAAQPDCIDCEKDLQAYFGCDFAQCEIPSCWFEVTDKRPKGDKCCVKYGSHCGTFVVVDSDCYEHLSRVTLAMLDIATVKSEDLQAKLDPPTDPSIEIEDSFDSDGNRIIKGRYTIKKSEWEKLGVDDAKDFKPQIEQERSPLRRESPRQNSLDLLLLPRN